MAGIWGGCGGCRIRIFKGEREGGRGRRGCGGDCCFHIGGEGSIGKEAVARGGIVPIFDGLRRGEERICDAGIFPVGGVRHGVSGRA